MLTYELTNQVITIYAGGEVSQAQSNNTPALRKITSDNLPLEQISKLLPVVESTSLLI